MDEIIYEATFFTSDPLLRQETLLKVACSFKADIVHARHIWQDDA